MDMDMSTHKEPEITIAAFLWCRGFSFVGCLPDEHRRGRLFFAFEDSDGKASQVRVEFLNGGLVAAKQYAAALADLKAQLYSAKDGNGNGQQLRNKR
jgi:hypothetical protein